MRAVRPRAVPAAAGGGTITHGKQISLANTGIAGLGVTLGSLTTVGGTHILTDFTAGGTGGSPGSPKIVEGFNFTGDVIFDQPWITLRGCVLANPSTALRFGVHQVGARLEYCEINPATVGPECMNFESWSAHRSVFRGCSDGAKVNGGSVTQEITECYIRVKMADATDHNDGLQNVGGNGTVNIRRCNISVNPEGGLITGGGGGPDACFLSADLAAGSVFTALIENCWLDGTNSNETLRFYDGGLTTNITYIATGNRFVRSSSAPVGRGASNTTPIGQITWSGNVWDDDDSTIPLA